MINFTLLGQPTAVFEYEVPNLIDKKRKIREYAIKGRPPLLTPSVTKRAL